MDITVYLPDEIGSWAKNQGINFSAMLRAAVEAERDRRQARAEIAAGGFERIEVRDEGNGSTDPRTVAFQGREIGSDEHDATAYLTPKGAIAVYDDSAERLYVYDDYEAFKADGFTEKLTSAVAESLGEEYVYELDI